MPIPVHSATEASEEQASCTAMLALVNALPLHAEEGPGREIVGEGDLLAGLIEARCTNPALMLGWVKRLFEAFCLLDPLELGQGRWAFVSFPASLMGRSILVTLATPGQTLFDRHYWEQGPHRPEQVIEEQRTLLQQIELRRERYHPSGSAQPIRTVHVAWAVIRFGDRFLLSHREDRSRHEGRDYVLPGGRLNSSDLPASVAPVGALRELMAIDPPLSAVALPKTLERELEEELGLLPEEYASDPWQTLEPFVKVEGARNHQALTRYHIVLFTLRLTQSGELRILRREAEAPDSIAWFSAEELEKRRNGRGQGAFIDALHASFGAELVERLQQIRDSRVDGWTLSQASGAFDLPPHPVAPMFVGKTGKEMPVLIDLDQHAWELFHILGRHALSLPVSPIQSSLRLLGGGWIRIEDEHLKAVAKILAVRLSDEGFKWVESVEEDLIRIGAAPDLVHLPPDHYRYVLRGTESEPLLIVSVQPLSTKWATLEKETMLLKLPPAVAAAIRCLESGRDPRDDRRLENADLEREFRRVITNPLRRIGLRKFVYTDTKRLRLVSMPSGTHWNWVDGVS